MEIQKLEEKIKWVKRTALDMVMKAGKGHLGGSFSIADVLTYLYYGNIMKFDPKNPKMKERDRLILSKGHANNTLYVILADLGFFPLQHLEEYSKNGALLGGHCEMTIPGIEAITGSLGHGLGISCGIALAGKLNNEFHHVYCIIGDGESQEGSIWEAIMFASQHKLGNLTLLIDYNKIGAEDFIKDTCELENLGDKFKSFNWNVRIVDGHNLQQIASIIVEEPNKMPTVIICNTIKGKGLYSLENTAKSHQVLPSKDDYEIIKKELLS